MKKIINNKVYDTSTAECVGEWSNGDYPNDLQYCSEGLYRKRTGEFFLYGEGGPMSKYSIPSGNNHWRYGEKIIPLTYQAAQEWAEEHLDGEEYKEIFGAVEEDESRTILTVSISAGSIARGKQEAAKLGISFSAYVQSLLDNAPPV